VYFGVLAENFFSRLTWNYPADILVPLSRFEWVGNYTTVPLLARIGRLDYLTQLPLPYWVVFRCEGYPGVPHVDVPDLSAMIDLTGLCDSCGEPTCCGLINQYATRWEACAHDLEVALWLGEVGILRQRRGQCVYYAGGRCAIYDRRPLWCRMYVCDRMWQRARSTLCLY
jgi:hypothetical protein